MLAITGTTGKIGGAVLEALFSQDLISNKDLVVLTSSSLDSPKVKRLVEQGICVRQANYADKEAVKRGLRGCDTFFLVSTPEIHLDFGEAPPGQGRESRHISAINGAISAGVTHVIYTSLAFKDGSQAAVMQAHFRTEAYLAEKAQKGELESYTAIREGLYAESWPLYLGHFKLGKDAEKRKEIVVASDGPISWTRIADLGLATALILTAPREKYRNKTLFLSRRTTLSLTQVAAMVGCSIKVVSPQEYVAHYRDQHGMDPAFLEWWVSTYPSVAGNHCAIDSAPLEQLLKSRDRESVPLEAVLNNMLKNPS